MITGSTWVRPLLLVSLALVLGIGIPACSAPDEEAASPEALQAVVFPNLDDTEAVVRQQFEAARARLSTLGRAAQVAPDTLGRAYGRVGQLLLAYEFLQAAEAPLRNAERLMPGEVRWPYYLGYLYASRGQFEQAVAAYERARKRAPDDITIAVRLAEAYLQLGHDAEARTLLEQAVREDPASARAHFVLGQIALDAGVYETAIEHYEAALKLQPEATRIHYALGMAYRNARKTMADVERGLQHLARRGNRSVQLRDPFLEEVGRLRRGAKMLSSRGSLLMARGRFQEAEEVFERAVAADTADALAHLNLGSIRARLGKTDQARAALERAVRLDPSQSIAYMLLGQLFARQGDPAAAERHYRTALQVDPRNDEAHLGLAAVLRHTGRCMEALRHVEQVLEITPGQVQAYLEQAMCYGQRGEDVRARAVLEAAHDVFPLHRGVRDALVRILAASPVDAARDGALALALSEKTVSEANHPATAEARAMAYAELGRYTEAIRWQETAVEAARARGETAYVEHLNRALQHYRQGRPSRTPWTSFYDEM